MDADSIDFHTGLQWRDSTWASAHRSLRSLDPSSAKTSSHTLDFGWMYRKHAEMERIT